MYKMHFVVPLTETSTVEIEDGKVLEVIKLEHDENLLLSDAPTTSYQHQSMVEESDNVIIMPPNVSQGEEHSEMIHFVDEQQPILKFGSYAEFKRTLNEYEAQTITKFILRNQSKQFPTQGMIYLSVGSERLDFSLKI